MNRTIVAAAVALGLSGLGAAASAATPQPCDRVCLKGVMTAYLDALAARNPAKVPAAGSVRVTEDAKDIKLGEGLWKTITGLSTYRQDFIDVQRGVVGSHVVVNEGASQSLFAVRLKVVNRKITEIETQVTHNQKEGSLFDTAALKAAHPVMNRLVTGPNRSSRDEIVYAAAFYPAGLQGAPTFGTIGAPFTVDAYRQENGVFAAGPPCPRNEACKNISTQPLGNGRKQFQQRILAVDEDLGVAWLRLSWGRSGGMRLVAYEAFKVVDGKMVAVEAFMKELPVETTSGWD